MLIVLLREGINYKIFGLILLSSLVVDLSNFIF